MRNDLVLICAGGNDAIGLTSMRAFDERCRALLGRVAPRAHRVVWLGPANAGLAPACGVVSGWWITHRLRRARNLIRRATADHDVLFVDFFHERGHDPYASQPQRFYAADGVHPSDAAYADVYATLRATLRATLERRSRRNRVPHDGEDDRWSPSR